MKNEYKGDKVTTNGLSEQHIFEIKGDYYIGLTFQEIAIKYGKTVAQIEYAVTLNE